MKSCYGLCDRCAWKRNGGCSEWNGYGEKSKEGESENEPAD